MNNMAFYVFFSPRPDVTSAEWPGRTLLEASLGACVNVLAGARSIPSNEVPEVVALPVADGHHPYLSWVASSTRTPGT